LLIAKLQMKRRPLWRVRVKTSVEAEEAVRELLSGIFGQLASIYTDFETRETTVDLFLAQKPDSFPQLRTRIFGGLRTIASCGLNTHPAKVSCTLVPNENWAESWKRHFKPLDIGSVLLIKPSWSKRRPKPGQATVVIDPGLSFGTGQHPTTSFCLGQLAALRGRTERSGFLDIGTGSGILAIAAAKLGYDPVEAFDLDPEAVQVARRNARKNRVERKIHFSQQDVTKLPHRSQKKYSLICANLISNLLRQNRARILARLSSDGVLVVAGILTNEFGLLQRDYEEAGLRLMDRRDENEWSSGSFRWSAAFTPLQ
jgi:ribosomal protein L11 methyltransferase